MLENLTHPLQCPIFKATKWWWGRRPPKQGPNTPQTNKKRWWGCRPHNRTKHPHHTKETVGSALLSHNPPVAVPSAQKGLTSRFGKDTGCNPLAKTTNTTNKQHPKKKGRNPPVSETIYPLNNPTHKPPNKGARQGRVGREPHSGRKHPQKQTTNQNQSMKYC